MWNFNLFGVGGIDWEESPHEAPFGLVVLWFVLSEWFAAVSFRCCLVSLVLMFSLLY